MLARRCRRIRAGRMKVRLLLLVFALTILVPMIALAVSAIVLFDRQQRSIVAGRGVETARALINSVDHLIAGSIATLETLGTAKSLERGDLSGAGEDARRILDRQRGWIAITLVSPQGRLLMDTAVPPGPPLPSVPEPETLPAVMRSGEPAIGGIAIAPLSRRFAFPVTVPIVRDGAIRYLLTAYVGLDTIQDILRRQEIPRDWVGTVFDSKRAVVARTRGAEQFAGGLVSQDFVRALDTAREGWIVTRSLEGTFVYSAFSQSATTSWGVGLGIPTAVIDGGGHRSPWTIAGGGAAVVILAAGLALLIGRRLARDLTNVADAATAIGRGAVVQVPQSGIAELDAVARGLAAASAQRNQAEAALRDNEARLTTTLSSIGDAVIATDLDGRVAFMNPVASAMTGWTQGNAAGRALAEVFSIVAEQTEQIAESPAARVLREGDR